MDGPGSMASRTGLWADTGNSIALFTGTQWPTEIVKRYIAAKLNAVLMQLSLTYLEVVFLHVLVYDSIAVKPNDFL